MKRVKIKIFVLIYAKLAQVLYVLSSWLGRKANYFSFLGNEVFSYK
jgi:hypothetical protein